MVVLKTSFVFACTRDRIAEYLSEQQRENGHMEQNFGRLKLTLKPVVVIGALLRDKGGA